MKMLVHKAEERGGGDYGWLKTKYSFSFATWYEPSRMGFGALRVINDDWIAPASGFGEHGHKDMEIVTIVTKGTVTHTDSMGNTGIVPAGDVQAMSAGTGVIHAEENSGDEELTLFQLWIEPNQVGVAPRYAQGTFNLEQQRKGMRLIVSPTGENESLPIHQDAYITHAVLEADDQVSYAIQKSGNGAYLFIIEGTLEIGGQSFGPRDAVGVSETEAIALGSTTGARILIIEVPV
jgi:redox-sensitive bicupin YhaK (pirin superfamily)